MTQDMWHVTLTVWEWRCFVDSLEKGDLGNELMNEWVTKVFTEQPGYTRSFKNLVIFWTNSVVFSSNSVIFRKNAVTLRKKMVTIWTNPVIIWQIQSYLRQIQYNIYYQAAIFRTTQVSYMHKGLTISIKTFLINLLLIIMK